MLAWDTETDKIRPAVLAPEMACLAYSDGHHRRLVWGYEARDHLEWLLRQVTATANGPYDCAVAWSWFPDLKDLIWDAILNGRIYDVITAQKLIDIGEGKYRFFFKKIDGENKKLLYNLSHLNARYTGEFLEKDEYRLGYGDLRPFRPETWDAGPREYALKDAETTAKVADFQQLKHPWMKRHPSEYLHNLSFQVPADWALKLMGMQGVATDDRQVARVIEGIDREQPVLRYQLMKYGLVDRDGVRKDKKARERMFQAVGVDGELTDTGFKRVKKGELSKAEALAPPNLYIKCDEEWCSNSGDPALELYGKYSDNLLLRTKILRFKTGRLPLHSRYEVLLETGRTSSSEDKTVFNSAALQNLPRKPGIRECVVARPGHVLIASDFGLAELVSLAQVTYNWFEKGRRRGDPWYVECRMRQALNAGKDIHVDFASEIMGIPYEEAIRRYIDGDEEVKKYRQWAKAVNFGLPGGLSVDSLVSYARKTYGVTLARRDAKRLVNSWFRKYPEMRMYFKRIRKMFKKTSLEDMLVDDDEVSQDRKFKYIDVQQEVSGRIRGRCRYTQACNTMFQGLTADGAKAALIEVSRRCYTVPASHLYGSRPVLFVHDEIIIETPEHMTTLAAAELERVMVEMYRRFTPDVVITTDAHAMLRWSKGAKAVRDESDKSQDPRGRLLPFVDKKFERELDEWAARAAA